MGKLSAAANALLSPLSKRQWRTAPSVEIADRTDGHYNAEAEINGRPIEVMIDTGASMVALTTRTPSAPASSLTDNDFTRRIQTANGMARVAPVTLDRVSIGDITVRDVPAAVAERGAHGESLLGMSFLSDCRPCRHALRATRAAGLTLNPFPSRRAAYRAEAAGSTLGGGLRLHLPSDASACQGELMLPRPRADLKPNTADFERLPLVKPTGFREYDARWLFPEEINLMGLNAIGLGMATLFAERGVPKRFVVGHDYRSYSASA